ncbi:hypothetical protein OGZ51_02920 [Lactococcus lactis]|jgi:hypothetical protein|uniref:Uncharacterized protein n=1 Tax=Lactococcus lactis TaxID=1358 RepID=A0A9X4NFI8_9LACT|nr:MULTISPECIES: hypothetical protein [Lactococcus]MCD6632158.1 hypothetical protein [Lactococcus cremoris]MDG4983096.1 hypothetical protein [Lactococcus lactis]MDG4985767.1 hypothetical protein [Lactococcus lactis]PFG84193.1 hypothetical protein BW152_09145 [Lactococcus lactis]
MKYTAILGDKFIIEPFETVPLKLDHTQAILPATVVYGGRNQVYIYTDLEYNVGQCVSIGGYSVGGKKFRLIELSITDYPVLDNALITEKEKI